MAFPSGGSKLVSKAIQLGRKLIQFANKRIQLSPCDGRPCVYCMCPTLSLHVCGGVRLEALLRHTRRVWPPPSGPRQRHLPVCRLSLRLSFPPGLSEMTCVVHCQSTLRPTSKVTYVCGRTGSTLELWPHGEKAHVVGAAWGGRESGGGSLSGTCGVV